MANAEIEALVSAANQRLQDPERNRVVNGDAASNPRFELYHFALSLCSHKVRTVMNEKELSYTSHDVNILPPGMENYLPEYARLRMRGGSELLGNMVDGYTGRSSTQSEGFDPLVVPTLVDHDAGRVLVDSQKICLYLNESTNDGTELVPHDIADDVMRQVEIVDRTPHPAVLYGANPEGDGRPDFIQTEMPTIHDRKIAEARRNMATVRDDPTMVSAYEHKILKESAAKEHVNTEAKMRSSVQEFKDIVGALESDLARTGGEWLIGDRFTLADVVWAVSLFRMQWLGLGYIWATNDKILLPRVTDYCKRLFVRPSFQDAVVHWPGNPPSPHVMAYYQ
jgi:2,5-dichlorohydroquinone reductive dechlorinase